MSTEDKEWSNLEALARYNEFVKPKTFTLFNDAGTRRGDNIAMLVGFLFWQLLKDQHTMWRMMWGDDDPRVKTEKAFCEYLLGEAIKQYDKQEQRQGTIDKLKNGPSAS